MGKGDDGAYGYGFIHGGEGEGTLEGTFYGAPMEQPHIDFLSDEASFFEVYGLEDVMPDFEREETSSFWGASFFDHACSEAHP
jgi:hypothetical protein